MPVEIIGQKALIEKINNNNLDTFPHSLMLVGEKGSGKHLICDYISDHLNIEKIDITESISLDTISDIYLQVEPRIYVIDGSKLTDKKENALLKLIEEPPINSFIIILCEIKEQLLPTIINRCQVWYMESYTIDDLKKFSNDELILNVALTPGQILKLKNQKVEDIFNLCNTIIDRIGNANIANTLTITNKLALNDEEDKFDLDVFILAMNFVIHNKYREVEDYQKSQSLFNAFLATRNLYNSTHIPHVNLKHLFDNYFIELKYTLC